MRPSGETSQLSASPGSGRAVLGLSRVKPSNIEVTIRISAMPSTSAGSSVSGSMPLTMTRSARGSLRMQPPMTNASGRKRRNASANERLKRRNPRRFKRGGFGGKFIPDYLGDTGGVLVETLVVAGVVEGTNVLVELVKIDGLVVFENV